MASLNTIYDDLLRSNTKVIERVKAVVNNDQERDSLKHFKRYVRRLDSEKTSHVLTFCKWVRVNVISKDSSYTNLHKLRVLPEGPLHTRAIIS